MKVELMVGMIIPDTTAITAFHTLERMGFSSLKQLTREDYYSFSVTGNDFDRFSGRIGKVDVLVNANKNRFATKRQEVPFTAPDDGFFRTVLLVQSIDPDAAGLLSTLKERLGFRDIESMERGVLWTLGLEAGSAEEAMRITKDVAERLLVNRHYQRYRISQANHV